MSQASNFPDCLIVQRKGLLRKSFLWLAENIFLSNCSREKQVTVGRKNEISSYKHSESDLITKTCLSYDKTPEKDTSSYISSYLMNIVLKRNKKLVNSIVSFNSTIMAEHWPFYFLNCFFCLFVFIPVAQIKLYHHNLKGKMF